MKNKKNILIYTTSDFPNGGAAENFVRQMAIGLSENNANVSIVRLKGQLKEGVNDTKIPVYNLITKKFPTNEILKLINLFLQIFFTPFSIIFHKYKNKKNIIILYGVEYFYFTIPYLITCKLLNIKIFRIITDYYEPRSIVPVWWKKIKLIFYYGQFKYFDRYFNGIVVLSNYLKNIEIKNKVKNVLIINHFINFNFSIENKIPENDNKNFVIGFCGTTNVANGVFDLIEAFSLLMNNYENIKLLIIGSETEDLKNKIKSLTFKLQTKVEITGFLNKSEVFCNLQRCDILINPRIAGNFAEAGFPTKLGEYFALKKPVVTTFTNDFKIYFKDKKEVVFAQSNNPESLKEAILFLYDNTQERFKIAEFGYDWGLKNLEYNNNSKKLLNFIQ